MKKAKSEQLSLFRNILNENFYFFSSFLMMFSFPSYEGKIFSYFWIIAWFSLVPIFIYMKERPLKEVYIKSFLAGLVGNFLTYGWIGSFGKAVEYGDLVLLIFFIPAISIYFAVNFLAAEFLSRRFEKLRYLIFPSVWVLFDFLKTVGYFAFPWTFWGYSQYPFDQLIQMSSVTGIHGVTFLLIAANYLIAEFVTLVKRGKFIFSLAFFTERNNLKYLAFLIFLLAIIISGQFRLSTIDKSEKPGSLKLKIAMIQSCISPWENWSRNKYRYLSTLVDLTNRTITENPDFVIWSESSTIERLSFNYKYNPEDLFLNTLSSYIRSIKKPLITGEIGINFDQDNVPFYSNSAVLFSPDGKVVKNYSKMHLAPIGEYFPYHGWLKGLNDFILSMGASSFLPGNKKEIFDIKGLKFGLVICYESLFYRLNRDYKNLGADFLLNITNDGWNNYFKGHMQHFAAAKFRAIENGMWFVRDGNTGFTAIINPYGQIVKSIPILNKNYLVGEIDTSLNHKTFYSRFGDVFVLLVFVFILIIISTIIFREKIKN